MEIIHENYQKQIQSSRVNEAACAGDDMGEVLQRRPLQKAKAL